jgi:hypothetical protein
MATKYTKSPQIRRNGSKIDQNLPTSFIARHFAICPNRDFWFETKPSGNPGGVRQARRKSFFRGVNALHNNHCIKNEPVRFDKIDRRKKVGPI